MGHERDDGGLPQQRLGLKNRHLSLVGAGRPGEHQATRSLSLSCCPPQLLLGRGGLDTALQQQIPLFLNILGSLPEWAGWKVHAETIPVRYRTAAKDHICIGS